MNIVSKKIAGQAERSPHAIAGPKLLVPSSACCPMQVKSLRRPTDEFMLAFIKDSCNAINKAGTQATLTPCSPRAKPLAHSTSISPASPNNDLMSYKIIEANASGPSEPEPSDAMDAGQHSQDAVSMDITDKELCSPHASASPFLLMIRSILLGEGSRQWLEHKFSLPLTKVSGDEETRPDQTAISKAEINAYSHSPMPAAALTLPTNDPVAQLPAYPPHLNPEHEMWLRWEATRSWRKQEMTHL
jgi:hypothetical protein